ncbi:MAG: hypothetical protein WCF84_08950 [Anaerolineae bacterium]
MPATKILYNSSMVKQEIMRLFRTSKGRRVAISGFIGYGVEAYLPKPKGIDLICWPKPGSTNPNALSNLKKLGVNIFFADQLHMKVYWTEEGSVITSANLSTEALGASGQKEMGVLLPPGAIDIDKICNSIDTRPYTSSELRKLNREHNEYMRKNPFRKRPFKMRSFNDWLSVQTEFPWKMAYWEPARVRLAPKSKQVLEQEHGTANCYDVMSWSKGDFSNGDWLLCFTGETSTIKTFSWMFAQHVIRVRRTDDGPDQVIQVWPLRTYDQPPFKIDAAFTKAFKSTVKEIGGVDQIAEIPVKPSSRLIRLITKHHT